MKYIKKFENINWNWVDEEKEDKIIPYYNNNVKYGYYIHKNNIDVNKLKFKLEDIVISKATDKSYNRVGHIVDYLCNSSTECYYLIYFIDDINGHTGNEFNIPNGHGWWVRKNQITKL